MGHDVLTWVGQENASADGGSVGIGTQLILPGRRDTTENSQLGAGVITDG